MHDTFDKVLTGIAITCMVAAAAIGVLAEFFKK